MNKLYYFAYGSNILSERLYERIGYAKIIGTHRLFGYKLIFDTGYFSKFTFANITPGTPEDFIEGILYEVTDKQLQCLDQYEALYFKEFFTVAGATVAVYINNTILNITVGKPKLAYLNLILAGCKEHNLTHTFAKLTAFKRANYRLRGLKIFS